MEYIEVWQYIKNKIKKTKPTKRTLNKMSKDLKIDLDRISEIVKDILENMGEET